jgi:hypothetical protein
LRDTYKNKVASFLLGRSSRIHVDIMAAKTAGKDTFCKQITPESTTSSGSTGKESGKKFNLEKEKAHRTGLHKQLRKTKFCLYHLQGACRFGSECQFAHSLTEMHHTPDLSKTQLCKKFANGGCDDPNCNYAHQEDELRSTDVFFKKTLCTWNEKGKCRNGAKCRFAHGIKELRRDVQKEYKARLDDLRSGMNTEEAMPTDMLVGKVAKPSKVDMGDKGDRSAISRMAGGDPIKVLLGGKSMETPEVANMPPHAGDTLEALKVELFHTAQIAAKQQAAVENARMAAAADGISLHMDLNDIRQSVAFLNSCCNQLQERVDLSSGYGGSGYGGLLDAGHPAPGLGLNRSSQALGYAGQTYDARLPAYDARSGARIQGLNRDLDAFTGGYPFGLSDPMRLESGGFWGNGFDDVRHGYDNIRAGGHGRM